MPATYEPIATTTLGSAASSITFSGISSGYTDLRLVVTTLQTSNGTYPLVRFNSDSATNYSNTYLAADYSAASSGRLNNVAWVFGANLGGGSTTNPTMYTFDIFSYAGNTNKTVLQTFSGDLNGSGYVESIVALWRNTSAINTILIQSSASTFATGTRATLYGILKA